MARLGEVARGALGLVPRALPLLAAGRTLLFPEPRARRSLPWYVARAARRWPDQDAVRTPEGALTYRELEAASSRLGHMLLGGGVRPGDSVALLLENRPAFLACLIAIEKVGAVPLLVSTEQRGASLRHSLSVTHPRAWVVGEECVAAVDEALAMGGGEPPSLRFWVRDAGSAAHPAGYTELPVDGAADGSAEVTPAPAHVLTLADTAYAIFTSGTTGLPKASLLSYLRWEKAAVSFGGGCLDLRPGEALYAPLPLFHNNALTIGFGSSVVHGATLVTRRRFSASQFFGDIARYRAGAFLYIGEVPQYLLAQPPSPYDRAHPPLRALGNGLRPQHWRAFRERFGIARIHEIYAASEMNISFANLLDVEGSVGVCPAKWILVEYDAETGLPLRDARGCVKEVRRGEPGLLLAEVTPRYPFDGYSDAAASERKLARDVKKRGDRWFVSGDLLREQGLWHLEFVDRLGDTFRWKGENVSTAEVEAALAAAPGVLDAAAYGVEVPGSPGRAGMAAVTWAGAPRVEGLAERLRAELPAHAVPVFLRCVERLRTTATFKHEKGALKAEGYDGARAADPLFVLTPRGYAPLTDALRADLAAGRLRLG